MKVLFVGLDAATTAHCMRQVSALGVEAEHVPDPQNAVEALARGGCRVVAVALQKPSTRPGAPEPASWKVVEAAAGALQPARVVALVKGPIDPLLRRRAYGAGVWELLEGGRDARRATLLMDGIRRALSDAIEPMVLLVDECSTLTDELAAMIVGYGFHVETASTIAEAIRLMSARDYVLIVTETRRVGLDGFEVLKAAPRLQPGVPVVVLTANAGDDVLLRSIELGAKDCLWKLTEPDRIFEALRSALRPAGVDRTRTLSEDP